MIVRPRHPRDLAALLTLLERTHREVGYPVLAENVRTGWLADANELGARVAESDGRPVGHVALHIARGVSTPLWRVATSRDDDGLAVVSRLFSHARGAGTTLLATAVDEAHDMDLAPVLEVERRSAAYGFYLRRGWKIIGEVDQQWGPTPVTAAVLVLDKP